jgi:hypothetical protein
MDEEMIDLEILKCFPTGLTYRKVEMPGPSRG